MGGRKVYLVETLEQENWDYYKVLAVTGSKKKAEELASGFMEVRIRVAVVDDFEEPTELN